jgi:hypothetical protein
MVETAGGLSPSLTTAAAGSSVGFLVDSSASIVPVEGGGSDGTPEPTTT